VAAPGTATITASGVEPSTNAIEPVEAPAPVRVRRPAIADAQGGHQVDAVGRVQPDGLDGRPSFDTATLLLDGRVLMTSDPRQTDDWEPGRERMDGLGRAIRRRDRPRRPDRLDGPGARRRHRHPASKTAACCLAEASTTRAMPVSS